MSFSLDQANDLLKEAQDKGATDGDIFVLQGESFEGSVRLKEIEKVNDARGKSLTLRVFFGKRHAMTSTSDFTKKSLDALLSDTCNLAKISPEDRCAGLPESSVCAKVIPSFDLFDSEVGNLSIDEKIDMAIRAERAAFSADPRILNSEGASLGNTQTTVHYAATNGFSGSYIGSSSSLSVSPIASENGVMQRDYWYSTRRKYKELESAESVGATAAARTVRRLGARKVATQNVPVVFDPEMAASLIACLASALSGYALYKQASFLTDHLGAKIASDGVTIEDDPTLAGGLGTKPFDGEGLPSTKKSIVEKGTLKSYLLDTYSGKKLNLPSTGNASRGPGSSPSVGTTNFHLLPGPYSPEEIIASVRSGLYVTELIGFGVNTVTGDYSQGAVGIWISDGALAYPVEEITIAGNLKEMFLNIEQVGNDLSLFKRVAAPTLKIAQMTVAGSERG
ncbi:MAG: TldD/PmbA family protein [Nitrospirae bacterium]|nr:TldD/PmbA family protein [Candidatus Troglogloeales bacterium]